MRNLLPHATPAASALFFWMENGRNLEHGSFLVAPREAWPVLVDTFRNAGKKEMLPICEASRIHTSDDASDDALLDTPPGSANPHHTQEHQMTPHKTTAPPGSASPHHHTHIRRRLRWYPARQPREPSSKHASNNTSDDTLPDSPPQRRIHKICEPSPLLEVRPCLETLAKKSCALFKAKKELAKLLNHTRRKMDQDFSRRLLLQWTCGSCIANWECRVPSEQWPQERYVRHSSTVSPIWISRHKQKQGLSYNPSLDSPTSKRREKILIQRTHIYISLAGMLFPHAKSGANLRSAGLIFPAMDVVLERFDLAGRNHQHRFQSHIR